jgi:hypothetical protein
VAQKSDALTAVLGVVLNALPEPDDSTPWEAVLDFRNDPEAMESLRRLRRWLATAALDARDPRRIELELEGLLEGYTAHLRLHRMKTNRGTLQTFVILAANVLDAILHVRFSEAAKTVFNFYDRRVALLEAELSAPGREVAYIAQAIDAFGPDKNTRIAPLTRRGA